MKTIIKRSIAATSMLALAATLQWVSDTPFARSPQEAIFLLIAVVFSVWVAAWPGFSE